MPGIKRFWDMTEAERKAWAGEELAARGRELARVKAGHMRLEEAQSNAVRRRERVHAGAHDVLQYMRELTPTTDPPEKVAAVPVKAVSIYQGERGGSDGDEVRIKFARALTQAEFDAFVSYLRKY